MSDQSTSSKNDQEKPTTSNVKSPEPKSVVRILRAPKSKEKSENPGSSSTKSPKPKSVVRILRAPGSKSKDESMDEEELKDFMKKGGYLIASSGSEGEDEPLMFRAMKRSKRHQLEYMRAVEDLRKKSGVSVERKEFGEDQRGSVFRGDVEYPGISNKKIPESKSVDRFFRAAEQSWERSEIKTDYPRQCLWGQSSFRSFERPKLRDVCRREAELSYARRAEEARREGIEDLLNPDTPSSLEATMSFMRHLDRQATGPVDPEKTFEATLKKSLDEYRENMKKSSNEE